MVWHGCQHCQPCAFVARAQVLFREDATVDQLIDVIEGNRKYIKCLYVYNKIDVMGMDDVDRLSRLPNSVVISCSMQVRPRAAAVYCTRTLAANRDVKRPGMVGPPAEPCDLFSCKRRLRSRGAALLVLPSRLYY